MVTVIINPRISLGLSMRCFLQALPKRRANSAASAAGVPGQRVRRKGHLDPFTERRPATRGRNALRDLFGVDGQLPTDRADGLRRETRRARLDPQAERCWNDRGVYPRHSLDKAPSVDAGNGNDDDAICGSGRDRFEAVGQGQADCGISNKGGGLGQEGEGDGLAVHDPPARGEHAHRQGRGEGGRLAFPRDNGGRRWRGIGKGINRGHQRRERRNL